MPYLLLTLAALFWGGNYVVGHVLVQGVDPILMTEARWALTALLLGLLYRRQIAGSRHLLRANAPAVVLMSFPRKVSPNDTTGAGSRNAVPFACTDDGGVR